MNILEGALVCRKRHGTACHPAGNFFSLLPFFPGRFLRLILCSKLGTVIPSRRPLRLRLAGWLNLARGTASPVASPEPGRTNRPYCRRRRPASASRPFVDFRLDAVAGKMAVCKPRPPPPPLPDDLALLAEGARLALGEASPSIGRMGTRIWA